MLLSTTHNVLDRRLALEQHRSRIPSIIAALVRDGHIQWVGTRGQLAHGSADVDTQYRIGSITKIFTAIAVMRLRDEGKLHLDDLLDTHLPGTQFGQCTIAQLLSHTSGITTEPPGPWWERSPGRSTDELIAGLNNHGVIQPAGRYFHYSNVGFGLLGEVITRVRGMSWDKVIRTEILEPLGMFRTDITPTAPYATGWAVHPWADVVLPEPAHDTEAMAAAGQLWSTISDLVRLSTFLLGDTGDVLQPDTLAEMREPRAVDQTNPWDVQCGLGLRIGRTKDNDPLIGHAGSIPGFAAELWTQRKEMASVIYLTNSTNGAKVTLAPDLLGLLATHEPRMPAEWAPRSTIDHRLLELTGHWYWGPFVFALRLQPDNSIILGPARGGARTSRFVANPDGTWTAVDGYYRGEKLTVGRRPDGSLSHLEVNTFVCTRTPYDPNAPIPGGVAPSGWTSLAEFSS